MSSKDENTDAAHPESAAPNAEETAGKSETFGENSDFEIDLELPSIVFRSISTRPDADWFTQISIATVRRFFYLTKDWELNLRSKKYDEFSGTIVIHQRINGELFEFDGASIPVPWLVSLLTIGVLRPLGVLLVASIIHDFAFRCGYLFVKKAGSSKPQKVAIKRHTADALFRDIVTVVNGNRAVGYLAWYFVRLGYWLGVRFNEKRFTGRPPVVVGLSFLLLAGVVIFLITQFSLAAVSLVALVIYLLVYILTLKRLGTLSTVAALFWMGCVLLFGFYGAAEIKKADAAHLEQSAD